MTTTETSKDVYLDVMADVADGSTISDPEALTAVTSDLVKSLKQGLASFRGWTGILAKVAEARVQARALILTGKGTPDWSAKSDVYRLTIGAAEAELWAGATADEKRKNDAAIRQQVSRKFLEPAITDHALRTVEGLSDEDRKTLKWQEVTGTSKAVLVGEIPAVLKKCIAASYKSADLDVPEKFGGPAKGAGSDGRSDKPAASVQTEMETLSVSIAKSGTDGGPSFVSVLSGVHSVASAILVSLYGATEVKDRDAAKKVHAETMEVLALIGKTLDGKTTPEDMESIADSLYVPAKK